MSKGNWILTVLGALSLTTLLVLQASASSSSEVKLSDAERSRAEAAFRTNSKSQTVTTPTPPSAAAKPSVRTQPTSAPAPSPSPVKETSDDVSELGINECVSRSRECFDTQDMECAFDSATKCLVQHARHVKLTRYAVAAGCQLGKEAQAKELYTTLPKRDQRAMKIKCRRFGITMD